MEKCHKWCTTRFCIGTYAVHTLCLGCSPSSKMYCINVCGRYKLYTVLTDRNSNLKLNNDLASMQTWSSRMQMTFNIEKCKVLHLGSNNPNHQYTIPMSGEKVHTLEVTTDEKDLG